MLLEKLKSGRNPISTEGNREQYVDPNSVGAEDTVNDMSTEVLRNLVAGTGENVLKTTGETINYLGAVTSINSHYEGNWMGDQLKEWGAELEAKGTRLPDALKDPGFNKETLTNPKFWTNQMTRYIPQLLEFIFVSKGVGALGKKAVQGLAKKSFKTNAKGLYKAGRNTLEDTSEAVAKGAKQGSRELSGGGWAKEIIKDTGELTEAAANASSTIGAGIGGNLMSGLMNAASTYQQRAAMTDENGQALYSEEELSDMAAGTVKNNLYYLPVDVLSWGMTYAKGNPALKGLGSKMVGGMKQATNNAGKKAISVGFSKAIKGPATGLARLGKKSLREGFEESVQEVYEEWSALRAFEDATGEKDPRFDNKESEVTNFWDLLY